jgi:hypothetical protein
MLQDSVKDFDTGVTENHPEITENSTTDKHFIGHPAQ